MVLSDEMKLNDFLIYWISLYRSNELKGSTLANEKKYYDIISNSTIGTSPIKDITPMQLKNFIDELSNSNQKKSLLRILNNIFSRIQDNGLINKNPMKLFKYKIQEDNYIEDDNLINNKYLSKEEIDILLKALSKSKYEIITKFILATGLRKGEAIALTWSDINGEIRINKSFNSTMNEITIPKTYGSKRTIPLFKKAKEVLDTIPLEERNGNCFKEMNSKSYTTVLGKISKRVLGFSVTPHDLRHTFASRGLEQGRIAPKIMQNWLGHKSIQTTLNIYMHASKQAEQEALEIINNFM